MLRNIVRGFHVSSFVRNSQQTLKTTEKNYDTLGPFLLDNSPVKKKKVYDLMTDNTYLKDVKVFPIIELFSKFGFSHKDIGTVYFSQPRIARLNLENTQNILLSLSSMGYEDRELVKVVTKDPIILTQTIETLQQKYDQVFEYFSKNEIKEILKRNPEIFTLDMEELEFKIKYIHFLMGLDPKEIVYSKAIGYPLEHIITRFELHSFSGVFRPNTEKVRHKDNPKLDQMLKYTGKKLREQCKLPNEEIEAFTKITKDYLSDFSAEDDEPLDVKQWADEMYLLDDEEHTQLLDDIEGWETISE